MTFPRCLRCRKPVDEVDCYGSTMSDTMTFVIRCHGKRETVMKLRMEVENGTVKLDDAFGVEAVGPS